MGYLQDLYQGDREIFAHERRDDRDLAETLRARGYAVQMDEWTYYGPQTDAYLGQCYTIANVARGEFPIRELQAGDSVEQDPESRRYTLLPHDHMSVEELYEELKDDYPVTDDIPF